MKVLIILAAYNGEKYIREQIESILAQDNLDISLQVFDDGSKDKTIAIVSSIHDHKGRIKLIQNNIPTGSAANNFLNALKSFKENEIKEYDYVAFADQDDIWLPNKLQAATNMLQLKKSDLYMSNLILWEEKNNRKTIINKSHSQKKYDYLFEGGSAGCTYVFSSTFAIQLKKTIVNINYINWEFFSHDWFVYFFARSNHYKVVIDKNSFILYRVHETNVHGQLNTFSFFAIRERIKLIKNGWYFKQAEGFMTLLCPNSDEYKIYRFYTKNYFTRLYVLLRHNFSLIRSPKKAIQFFIISLFPLSINK
jgi:rhamnosyltransferase